MNNNKYNSKILLPFIAALSLTTFTTNTHAVDITTTANYTYGSTIGSDTSPTGTNVAVTSYGTDLSDTAGNSVSYNSFGDDTGDYQALVSGSGNYTVTSSVTYIDTVFNAGTAQNYTFDFNILGGDLSVGVNDYGDGLFGSAYAQAGYDFNISITSNGITTSLFNSSASLLWQNDIISLTESGASLGGLLTEGYPDSTYTWDAFSGTLDLGTFDAGESFVLTYGVTTYANGAIQPGGSCCVDISGNSSAQFGDPSGLNSTSFIYTTSLAAPTTSVPEASSFILMGFSLVGLGIRRKKIKAG